MRTLPALVLLTLLMPVAHAENAPPSAAKQLAAARKAGHTTFLVVKESSTRRVTEMRTVAREAQRRTPNSVVIEMNRAHKANRPIVKRYGLAGARLPITLIIAPNGAPAGGVPLRRDTLKRLLALVPTPRKAETLLALFERKAVFVVVRGPGMTGEAAALSACGRAAALLQGKGTKARATIVRLDLADKAERAYIGVLGADRKATQVAIHVYGFSGRKTGVLKGTPKVEDLVAAARKKAECCPGGKCG